MVCRPTLAALLLLSHLGFAAPADTPCSLETLLETFAADPEQGRPLEPISPEWIGTVKTVYTRDYKDPGPPEDIRFTHGGVLQHPKLKNEKKAKHYAIIARMRGKSYLGSEGPEYYQSLPDLKTVARCTKGSELEKLFGPNRGWTSGWGDAQRMHWTVGWTSFTRTKPDQLRYLSIFAQVSAPDGARDSRVDSIQIREGFFRPANPDSATEKKKYLRGDVLKAREEAEEKAKRDKYPRPLRDLLSAREKPDDHDLIAYQEFLADVRTQFDPKLIQQVLAHTHEDTIRFASFLQDIYLDDKIGALKIPKWDPAKRKQALLVLIDNLPSTKDNWALDKALVVALKSLGGGKLELRDPDSSDKIKMKVKRNSLTYGGVDHSPVLIEMAQRELRTLLHKRLP